MAATTLRAGAPIRRPRATSRLLAIALPMLLACLGGCGWSGSAASTPTSPVTTPSSSQPVSRSPFAFSVPAAGDRPPAHPICGTRTSPPHRFAHVIVLVLENHSYGQLIGPPGSSAAQQAPYLNDLAASCGLATNYHNITHPSLPNYLAATGGSTFGITYDCRSCGTQAPSVFSQVAASGGSWAVYAESMTSNCESRDQLGLHYTEHHNPPIFYQALRASCASHDFPMGSPTGGPLVRALQTGRLANYVFLAPNRCHDMHDCSIHTGDAWIAWWINAITASRVYRTQPTAILITVDEGTGGHIGRGEVCRQQPTDQSCHIPLLVISPYVRPHARDTQTLDHYALLRASEQLLGLSPLAAAAKAPSILTAFGLQ